MRRIILLVLFMLLPSLVYAQMTSVTATVTDPNGNAYASATGYAAIVCPGNQQPQYGSSPILTRAFPINGFDGTGTFTQSLYDVSLITPTGCGYQWHITASNGITSFITGTITSVTGSSVNLSATISAFAAPIPGGGGGSGTVKVNGATVSNPNFNGSSPSPDSGYAASTYKVNASNIITENPYCTDSNGGLVPNPATTNLALFLRSDCTFAQPGSGGPREFLAANYGVTANAEFAFDASVSTSNGNVTVTSGDPQCSSGLTGEYIFVTDGTTTIYKHPNTTWILKGTITGCTSGTVFTTSSAGATQNCSAACTVVFGTLDDIAWTNAWNATAAACGTLVPVAGYSLVSQGHFNTVASGCTAGLGTIRGSVAFKGYSPNSTILIPTPDLDGGNSSTCNGGVSSEGCFFSAPGIYVSNVTIWGAEQQVCPGFTTNTQLVDLNGNTSNNVASDFYVLGWCGGHKNNSGSGLISGIRIESFSQAEVYNVQEDGAGDEGLDIEGGGGSRDGLLLQIESSLGADNDAEAIRINSNVATAKSWFALDPTVSALGGNQSAVVVTNNSTWTSTQDIVPYETIAGGENVYVGGTAYLNQDFIENTQTGLPPNYALYIAANSTVYSQGTQYSINSNPSFATAIGGAASSGRFFDLGGNTFTTNTSSTITIFGSPSITGTAQTTGNISLTNWGSGAAVSVSCSGCNAGDSHLATFQVTVGSGPSASPTISYTFPTAFLAIPQCYAVQIGGTQGLEDLTVTTAPTTTAVGLTWNGTPANTNTVLIQLRCQ